MPRAPASAARCRPEARASSRAANEFGKVGDDAPRAETELRAYARDVDGRETPHRGIGARFDAAARLAPQNVQQCAVRDVDTACDVVDALAAAVGDSADDAHDVVDVDVVLLRVEVVAQHDLAALHGAFDDLAEERVGRGAVSIDVGQ